mgnify:CR=1 FL=1
MPVFWLGGQVNEFVWIALKVVEFLWWAMRCKWARLLLVQLTFPVQVANYLHDLLVVLVLVWLGVWNVGHEVPYVLVAGIPNAA